jgi:outer membrane protein assembly factor BamB
MHFYVPFGPTKLAALRVTNGQIDWIFDTRTRIRSSPALAREALYLAAGYRVLAIAQNGDLKLEFSDPKVFFFGGTVIAGDLVVVQGSENPDGQQPKNFVYAFDVDTLDLRWKANAGRGQVVSCDTAGVSSADHRIFAGGRDGRLRCLDLESGKLVWEAHLGVNCLRSRPTYHDGRVYVTSFEDGVFCIDAADGSICFHVDLYEEGVWSPAVVHERKLLIHSGASLFLLDPVTGEREAEIPIGYHAYTAPVPIQKDILICGGDPPDHGCLFRISIEGALAKPPAYSRTIFPVRKVDESEVAGEVAEIELEFEEEEEDLLLTLDARSLHGSAMMTLTEVGSGIYRWVGRIPDRVKQGRWVGIVLVKGQGEGNTVMSLLADFRVRRDLPEATEIEDVETVTQKSPTYSGPATILAFLKYYGVSNLDQDDIKAMGDWMIATYDLDLHHKWRAGSLRIFHGSGQRRLPEMEGQNVEESIRRGIDDD